MQKEIESDIAHTRAVTAVMELISPLKPGLRLARRFELLDLEVDLSRAKGWLAFESRPDRSRFDVGILPRREGSFWEARTEHFHLRRDAVAGHPLSEDSKQALRALVQLVRRNEPGCAGDLLVLLRSEAEEFQQRDVPEKAVGNKVYIRVTRACQLDCIFCNATEGLDSTYLEDAAVYRALEKGEVKSLSQVVFSGGEPTLNDSLPAYAARAVELGAKLVVVQTNGIRLSEAGYLDQFEGMQAKVGFGFSIHAPDEEINRLVTGRENVFDRQWCGLEEALKRGFGIMVVFVITRPTLTVLPRFIEKLAVTVGDNPLYQSTYFAYPVPNGNAWINAELMPSFDEAVLALKPALDRSAELGINVHMHESCSTPRCIFYRHGMKSYLSYWHTYPEIPEINPTERRKLESCKSCRFYDICPGVWHRYFERFGESGIVPVQ